MFNTVRQLFSPKNKKLRNKIYFTLGVAVVYLAGKQIQVPGTTPIVGDPGSVFNLLDVLSGNALSNVSIFALGVGPYITASIVIQLLSMDVIPALTRLSQEGEVGKRKLNRITRYFAIVLAMLQGFSFALLFDKTYGVVQDPGASSYMLIVLTLTAGTAFVLWLGDQITQKGIGNGVSFIIMIGIVSGLPSMFQTAYTTLVAAGEFSEQLLGIGKFALFVIMYVVIIIFVVYVQEGVRKVAIQYSNRNVGAYGGSNKNFIPFKVNSAGVIPVIFSYAVIGAPLIIVSIASYFTDTTAAQDWINRYLDINNGVGLVLYIILIIMFAYFYTFIQVDPNKLSENLQQSGAYVPGIRPGDETAKYFTKILYRLTFFGSIFIALIAGLPIFFANFTDLPQTVKLGGTSILIVVGVSLEIIRQIEQQLVGYDYEGYVTK